MADATQEFTYDELSFIQTVPVRLLAAAARGEIDFNALAFEELASRGCDESGSWVGFDRAQEALLKRQGAASTRG